MSSAQGITAGGVMLAALGAAAIEAITPPPPRPPVIIEELTWDGERVIYDRYASRDTLVTWAAVVLSEDTEKELCDGAGRATYDAGMEHHVWSLDKMTDDAGCSDRIPPDAEVYILVTITPLDGSLPYSKRSGPFKVKPRP